MCFLYVCMYFFKEEIEEKKKNRTFYFFLFSSSFRWMGISVFWRFSFERLTWIRSGRCRFIPSWCRNWWWSFLFLPWKWDWSLPSPLWGLSSWRRWHSVFWCVLSRKLTFSRWISSWRLHWDWWWCIFSWFRCRTRWTISSTAPSFIWKGSCDYCSFLCYFLVRNDEN